MMPQLLRAIFALWGKWHTLLELLSGLLVGFSVAEIKLFKEVIKEFDLVQLGKVTKAMSKTRVRILSTLD